MRDVYRNPTLYYILVPAVVALWPLLVGAVYLPAARNAYEHEKEQYKIARKTMKEILELDRGRLEMAQGDQAGPAFDYAVAVNKVASACKIPPTQYTTSTKPSRISSGQKTRSAQITLKQATIEQSAKFLTAMQLRWKNLKCEKLTLDGKKDMKDGWKTSYDFKYYY